MAPSTLGTEVNPGFEQPPSPVPVTAQPSGYDIAVVEGDQGHAIAMTVHTLGGSHTTFMPLEFWTDQLWPVLERTNEAVRSLRAGITPVVTKLHLPPGNGHRG